MAKIIDSDIESQIISSSYSLWKIAIIGSLSGLLSLILALVIKQNIIIPIFCNSTQNIYTCLDSASISGNISIILVAIISIIVMLRFKIGRPLIIAVATGAALWGMAYWIDGLSTVETIFWYVVSYILSYILFSWVARNTKVLPVLIFTMVIIFSVRIAAIL